MGCCILLLSMKGIGESGDIRSLRFRLELRDESCDTPAKPEKRFKPHSQVVS